MGITDLVLGTDVVHLERIQASYQRFGMEYIQRFLTETEIEYCQLLKNDDFLRRAAGKIAVKEAVSKALGVGMNGLGWSEGLRWHDIEVLSKPNQPPTLMLHGKAFTMANSRDIQNWRISLAHDKDVITATAVGLISKIKTGSSLDHA